MRWNRFYVYDVVLEGLLSFQGVHRGGIGFTCASGLSFGQSGLEALGPKRFLELFFLFFFRLLVFF